MMVTCPRCEFSQPEDQYCANCGVDMKNYKPRQKSLLSRAWDSPWTQVLLMIILLAITINYILYKNQPTKSEPIVQTPEATPSSFVDTQDESEEAPLQQLKKEPSPAAAMNTAENQIPAATTVKPAPAQPETIQIAFAEVTNSFINDLQSNHRTEGRAIVIKSRQNLRNFLNEQSGVAILPGGSVDKYTKNQNIYLNYLNNINNEEYGMVFEATPKEFNAQQSTTPVSFKLNVNLPATTGPTPQDTLFVNLESNINTQLNHIYVYFDIFSPERGLSPEEQARFGTTPLSILNSPEFINNETTFAIFIQVR